MLDNKESDSIEFNKENYDRNTDEYYIELSIDNFKTLSTNQYYQMQLTFVKETEKSLPSQVTLILPIPKVVAAVIEQKGNLLTLEKVSGFIQDEDGSTLEPVAEYYVSIKQGDV